MVSTKDYLSLSALAYVDFKDPSNPLRSWKVIAQSPSSVNGKLCSSISLLISYA